MGKKRKKAKKKSPYRKQKATAPKKSSKYPLMALSLGVALISTGGFYLYQDKPPPVQAVNPVKLKKKNINLRETRPTLPPTLFSGGVRKAYQIARDIPEVLDKLYCYCMCKENSRHKNLLTCYVDNHAATWGICTDQTQLASKMYTKGATTVDIQAAIDRKFGKKS